MICGIYIRSNYINNTFHKTTSCYLRHHLNVISLLHLKQSCLIGQSDMFSLNGQNTFPTFKMSGNALFLSNVYHHIKRLEKILKSLNCPGLITFNCSNDAAAARLAMKILIYCVMQQRSYLMLPPYSHEFSVSLESDSKV